MERQCAKFYAPVMGRPSLAPGRYFRLLLVGCCEGIGSERGIAWRATDSLAVRSFLRLSVDEPSPDHSTISRTRRAIDLETHRGVFSWVQQRLVAAGLLKGKTIPIDATTLAANAAIRSIVSRDTEQDDQEFLTSLAQASGIETPTREDLARVDRKRKKTTSNQDWKHPWDPAAKVAKMKDGRTHLAHKADHAVDLDTGAIVAVTVLGADQDDTTTIIETAIAAAEQIEAAHAEVQAPQLASVTTFTTGCWNIGRRGGAEGMAMPSPDDMRTPGRDAFEDLNFIKVTPAPARFRAFPDDTGVALEGDKPVACVGPILKLLDGEVIAGLAAGTAAEECPRNIDHPRRALAFVKQRSPAPETEASGRLCVRIREASDTSLTLHYPDVLAPTSDIGRICGAVRAPARLGVIVPRPKSGKVDL